MSKNSLGDKNDDCHNLQTWWIVMWSVGSCAVLEVCKIERLAEKNVDKEFKTWHGKN
jgi:hypothetical protein